MKLILAREGLRMFGRRIRVGFEGLEKYSGDDVVICKRIVDECYDAKKSFFRVSNNNYTVFYARDFGWCVQALINLGHEKKVLSTLSYALKKYSEFGEITVAINPSGKAFNFPDIYSPDSVAYLFYSLRVAKAKNLIMQYSDFLNREILKFEEYVIDQSKGIVKNENFSGMRDYEIVKQSCYDMIMACMLDREIDSINNLLGKKVLVNHLNKYNLKKNLLKYYWNGRFFKNTLKHWMLTGHCNVYPFWLGIIDGPNARKMLLSCIKELHNAGYDSPMPLKYGQADVTKYISQEFFVQGWEHDTVWTMLGLAYIDIVSKVDIKLAKRYLLQYKNNIIRNKAFIEVYTNTLKPYKSLFYMSDTGMLWAAMYLDLRKRILVGEK